MVQYRRNQELLYETPAALPRGLAPNEARARQIIGEVRSARRTLLTEFEAKELLACYGIPAVPTEAARNADEAAVPAPQGRLSRRAEALVGSHHAQDRRRWRAAQLARRRLRCASHSRRSRTMQPSTPSSRAWPPDSFLGVTVQPMIRHKGYELIVGSSVDAAVRADDPLRRRRCAGRGLPGSRTGPAAAQSHAGAASSNGRKSSRRLQGIRGQRAGAARPAGNAAGPFQLPAVRSSSRSRRSTSTRCWRALRACSRWMPACYSWRPAHRWRPAATDDRTVSEPVHVKLAAASWQRGRDPRDSPGGRAAHEAHHATLSEQSIRMRFFSMVKTLNRENLIRLCHLDYAREMALVAERRQSERHSEILGVSRYYMNPETRDAEFAVVVTDALHGQGLGQRLMRRLIEVARERGVRRLIGNVLRDNRPMLSLAQELGFKEIMSADSQVVQVALEL